MDCLVTKLKGTVNDISLKALGELTLKYKGAKEYRFQCLTSKDSMRYVVKSGNAVFLGGDFSLEIGKDVTIPANSWRALKVNDENEVVVGVMDKYSLTGLNMNDNVSDYDLSELIYSTGLLKIRASSLVTGDISVLRNLKYTDFWIEKNANVTGNLSDFPNSLANLYINGQCQIKGNFDDIPVLMPNLGTVQITNQTAGNMSGSLKSLANMPKLAFINIYSSGMTYNWDSTTLRDNSYPRIAMASKDYPITFASPTDADNFIINMSTCSNEGISTEKSINVTSRTAASNSAVQTLISDGWKVYVNAVEQTGDESFD